MQGQTKKFHTESVFLLYGGRMDPALGKKKILARCIKHSTKEKPV